MSRACVKKAGLLAQAYIDLPDETTLLNFLALGKVGLAPDLKMTNADRARRLTSYPKVSWPSPSAPGRGSASAEARAQRLVELGRLGAAMRCLDRDFNVARADPAIVRKLQDEHPFAPQPIFPPGRTQTWNSPDQDAVVFTIRKLSREVAPGILGWTPDLLKLASRETKVVQFVHMIT